MGINVLKRINNYNAYSQHITCSTHYRIDSKKKYLIELFFEKNYRNQIDAVNLIGYP